MWLFATRWRLIVTGLFGGLIMFAAMAAQPPAGSTGVGAVPVCVAPIPGETAGQEAFAQAFAQESGLSIVFVRVWLHFEMNGAAAQRYEDAGYFDWLNIGNTDSLGAFGNSDPAWRDATTAGIQSAKWLKGQWFPQGFGPAAAGIQAIARTAGQSPVAQAAALVASPWASSHYADSGGLAGFVSAMRTGAHDASAQCGSPGPAGYPLAVRGKLIGTPYTGTHAVAFNRAGGSDNWQSENAVDIGVPVGTPVMAVCAGVIDARFGNGGSGRFAGLRLTIDCSDGQRFYYAHLSAYAAGIGPGSRVATGQVLGASGSANGTAHLHIAQETGDPMVTFGFSRSGGVSR